jgi:chromosome segregation ATPase
MADVTGTRIMRAEDHIGVLGARMSAVEEGAKRHEERDQERHQEVKERLENLTREAKHVQDHVSQLAGQVRSIHDDAVRLEARFTEADQRMTLQLNVAVTEINSATTKALEAYNAANQKRRAAQWTAAGRFAGIVVAALGTFSTIIGIMYGTGMEKAVDAAASDLAAEIEQAFSPATD